MSRTFFIPSTPEEQVDATLLLWETYEGDDEDEAEEYAEKALAEAVYADRAVIERREGSGTFYAERAATYVHDFYGGRFFGIIRMQRRLFKVGDIVIGRFQNGEGRRWPVWGHSSRGFDVKDYYLDFQRWKQGRKHALDRESRWEAEDGVRDVASHDHTQGRLLVCPDHLLSKPARDPAIRAWLVEQAWLARRTPVTADSGGLSSGGEA